MSVPDQVRLIDVTLLSHCKQVCDKVSFTDECLKNESRAKDLFINSIFPQPTKVAESLRTILELYYARLSLEGFGKEYSNQINNILGKKENQHLSYLKERLKLKIPGRTRFIPEVLLSLGALSYFLEGIGRGERFSFAIMRVQTST